jgi:hypothetical protein
MNVAVLLCTTFVSTNIGNIGMFYNVESAPVFILQPCNFVFIYGMPIA